MASRAARISAKARELDEEAFAKYAALSKRAKTEARCKFMAEERNMARGDRESKVFQQIDLMHAEIKRLKEAATGVKIPDPKFRTGQSVLQWWSPWMKNAEETPPTYNKKNRPAWFSAEALVRKRRSAHPGMWGNVGSGFFLPSGLVDFFHKMLQDSIPSMACVGQCREWILSTLGSCGFFPQDAASMSCGERLYTPRWQILHKHRYIMEPTPP